MHPVLKKIDVSKPFFRRNLTFRNGLEERTCELCLWLPVTLDNGGWVAAVLIEGCDLPISAMPGSDPLDALLNAIRFARDVIDRSEGRFLFTKAEREGGGLPIFLGRGFPPPILAALEARAQRFADRLECRLRRR